MRAVTIAVLWSDGSREGGKLVGNNCLSDHLSPCVPMNSATLRQDSGMECAVCKAYCCCV